MPIIYFTKKYDAIEKLKIGIKTMTLSNKERQDIKEQLSNSEKYLLEVMSGDRKAHAIHFSNLDSQMKDIKDVQAQILNELRNNKELDHYKDLMKPYEILMYKKRVPFYLICVIFVTTVWEQVPAIWEIVKTKILGI